MRVVQMYGVDLSVFQFDADLTFAAFMLNADRTIYGRYGSRSQGGPGKGISLPGLKEALQGALELHAKHPNGSAGLAKKTGPVPPWKTPETIPDRAGKHKKGDVSRWGCVHCHMTHESEVRTKWRAGTPITDALLWKYPSTRILGFRLDPKKRAKVSRVDPGSAAAKAGLQAGDVVAEMDGQPILSIADVDWALHLAPESGTVAVRIRRGESQLDLKIPLTPGWRRAGFFIGHPRRLSSWFLQKTILGFTMKDLDEGRRKKLGLSRESSAIEVGSVSGPKTGWSKAALKAGLRNGDVIVGVDGTDRRMRASDFLAYVFQEKKPGGKVPLKVRRGGKTVALTLTLP